MMTSSILRVLSAYLKSYKEADVRILKKAKTIYIKVDDFREEKLEVFVKNTFAKLDENETVDNLEEKGIVAAITAANAYAATYGLPSCPEEIKIKIAKVVVKEIGKINKKIQKQLDKKSKAYLKRHEEVKE